MNRIIILLLVILPLASSCGDRRKEQNPPNIILILADDMGYGDLDCYGNTLNDTPNLDQMARGGLLFTDFHSNGPVCSPTRAALMAGKYQQKTGIEAVVYTSKFRHTGITPGTYTLANYAKSIGYSTGIIGKWHLGYDTIYSPLNYGFDYFRGYVSGNVDYHSHLDNTRTYDWWEQKDTIKEPGYSTDLITENAVQFILDNKGEPFFLYVSHEAPHSPYQGRQDPPERTFEGINRQEKSPEDLHKTYREMISVMDEGVGEIFKTLEITGLIDNTLIFFMSDNGANRTGSNALLRGFKGSLWEGGHRVPAMAFWKDRIEQGTSDEFLLGMDIFPTLASIIGENPPEGIDLDGIDFSQVLLEGESLPERTAYWRYGQESSVRRGQWKLLVHPDSSWLFNLSNDPSEEINLIRDQPALSDSLLDALLKWEEKISTCKLNTFL